MTADLQVQLTALRRFSWYKERRARGSQFAHVRALASALANYDGATELDRALDILLFGLTDTAAAPDGPSQA